MLKKVLGTVSALAVCLSFAMVASAASPVKISDCDAIDGWTFGGATGAVATDGDRTCFEISKTGTADIDIRYLPAGIDASGQTHVEFDLYTSDATVLSGAGDCAVSVGSKTDWNDDCINYPADKMKAITLTENGWTHVKLALADFAPTGTDYEVGGQDYDASKVTFVRIYAFQNPEKDVTLKLDNVQFTGGSADNGDGGKTDPTKTPSPSTGIVAPVGAMIAVLLAGGAVALTKKSK